MKSIAAGKGCDAVSGGGYFELAACRTGIPAMVPTSSTALFGLGPAEADVDVARRKVAAAAAVKLLRPERGMELAPRLLFRLPRGSIVLASCPACMSVLGRAEEVMGAFI